MFVFKNIKIIYVLSKNNEDKDINYYFFDLILRILGSVVM